MRTLGAKKEFTKTSEQPRRFTWEKNFVNQFDYNDYMAYHYAFMMKVASVLELEKNSEAAKDLWWVEAMNEEMQALSKNGTWDLVRSSPPPKGDRMSGYLRWSTVPSTPVNQYKVLLVAKMTIVRTVISLATAKWCRLHHMDVKNTFLQGELEEEVYMVQPPGFKSSSHPQGVCWLKSLSTASGRPPEHATQRWWFIILYCLNLQGILDWIPNFAETRT